MAQSISSHWIKSWFKVFSFTQYLYINLNVLGRDLNISAQLLMETCLKRCRFSCVFGRILFGIYKPVLTLLQASQSLVIQRFMMRISSLYTPVRCNFIQSNSQMSKQDAFRVTLIPYSPVSILETVFWLFTLLRNMNISFILFQVSPAKEEKYSFEARCKIHI